MKWKTSPQRIALFTFIFLLGLFIGLLFHVPFFTLKNEVDIGALVSILALFAATFIVPLVVNKYLSNTKTYQAMVVHDIDESLIELSKMKDYYAEISFNNRDIDDKDRGYILHTCRTIQNALDSIEDQLKNHEQVSNFSTTALIFTREVRPAYSDFLVVGSKIDSQTALNALNTMTRLVSALKSTRYKLYTR